MEKPTPRPQPQVPVGKPPHRTVRGGWWVSVLAVVTFVGVWELAHTYAWVNPVLLSAPSQIAHKSYELLRTDALAPDLWFTFRVFIGSITTALLAGISLGFAMGYSSWAYYVLSPFVIAANSLPKIVLMPLVVLWLGISMRANIFLGALMASFPIMISVYTGVRGLDRNLILLAKSYRASRWILWKEIVLPSLVPFVLSGLRIAISYAMVGGLIAEFFASSQGIGHLMVLYMSNFQVDAFFVCVVLVALFTTACTGAVRTVEKRVEAWRPSAFSPPGM